jgi:hypothetical protein
MSTLVRTIRLFHTVQGGTTAFIRRGEKPNEGTLRNLAFDPKYFPVFLGVTCVVSGVAGFQFVESLKTCVPVMNRALTGEH